MIDLNKIITRSQRNIDRAVYYTLEDSQSLFYSIKEYYQEHPNATSEDLSRHFQDTFSTINELLVRVPTIRSEAIRYNVAQYVLKHPEVVKTELEKIKLEGINITNAEKQNYSSNKDEAIRTLIIELTVMLENTKKSISDEEKEIVFQYIKAPSKVKNSYRKSISSQQRRNITLLADVFGGTEEEQLIKALEREMPYLKEDLKKSYISSLLFVGECLLRFNFIGKYCEDQRKVYSRFGNDYLGLTYSKNDIEDLFNNKNLEKLSIDQLAALNTFWINRFSKEISTLNKMFFIADNHDLWEMVKNAEPDPETGIIDVELDEDTLRNTYLRMNVLHELTSIVFNKAAKKIGKIEVDETGLVKVSVDEEIKDVAEEVEEEYFEYFDKQGQQKGKSLEDDIDKYRVLDNCLKTLYQLKDANIIAMLASLQDSYIKNWGIILDDDNEFSYSKILIGVDIDKLNMPLRLHIEEDMVADFLKAYGQTSLIPIYEGNKDFTFQYRNVGTQVLSPLDAQKVKVIESLKNNHTGYLSMRNFIHHLAFLANSNQYPEHLKVEKVKTKKGKTKISKEIPPKRFYDLNTGATYIEEKGQLIEHKDKSTKRGAEDGRV